jgi:hypothetical protein
VAVGRKVGRRKEEVAGIMRETAIILCTLLSGRLRFVLVCQLSNTKVELDETTAYETLTTEIHVHRAYHDEVKDIKR